MKLKYTFYDDVEKDMKYVLYSDTDSLYINLPNYKTDKIEDSIKKGYEVSDLVNNAIKQYVNTSLAEKTGIDIKHNQIDFKTEYLIDSLILLDAKKNYAYKLIAKEGNILPQPKIEYTGVPVVKTDSPKFTQQFIRDLIEKIALSSQANSSEFRQIAIKLVNDKYQLMEQAIYELDFHLIGAPKKWGSRNYAKDPYQVVGMKLWNTLTSDSFFTPASSGLHIPVIIKNINQFQQLITEQRYLNEYTLSDTSITLLNSLVIPYKFDKHHISDLFQKYHISIDKDSLWDKRLYNVTVRRILDVIKQTRS
jgi:hypothetical protein